ncbi:MAG TPA: hypothetical protein VM512_07295 [Burkholderiaceae bacterium]|nr:hypothetical protein [Burkholderiaceae bacterium]
MASPSRKTSRDPSSQRQTLALVQPSQSPVDGVNYPSADDHRPNGSSVQICQAEATEVVKRLKPGQAGTRALQRRYGPALVCVRYRKDAGGNTRYTTVELVVDHGPPRRQPLVRVAIRFNDPDTRFQALALGAEWDATQKTWRMPRRAAIQLGLISNKRKAAK